MTDTTDIKALRRRSNNLRTPDQTDAFIDLLLDKLEAECQRADELQAEQKQHDAQIEQMEGKIQLITIGFRLKTKHCEKAAAELAALKGEQVPVAWTDAEELRGVEKDGCGYLFKVDPANPFTDPRRQIMLYDRPQKPVIDLSNVLKVPYKISGQRFTAYDSDDLHAAIEAAGGIVKDGE